MLPFTMNSFRDAMRKPAIQYGLLGAVTIAAGLLRFYKLGEWSFWYDEVFTVNYAAVHFSDFESFFARPLSNVLRVPVSELLTAQVFKFYGVSEYSARLVPAIFGVVTIPVIYLLVRSILGGTLGLLGAMFLTLNPWHLFWSQNARFYSSLLFFSMVGVFFFYQAFEKDRPKYLFFGYVFMYLSISERLTAFLAFVSIIVYLAMVYALSIEKPAGFNRKNIILFAIPLVAFILLEFFQYLLSGSSLLSNVVSFFSIYDGPSPLRLLYRIVLQLGVPLVIAAVLGVWFVFHEKPRLGLFLSSYAFVPIILLVGMNPFLLTHNRYAFISLPGWIILAALSASSISFKQKLSWSELPLAFAIPLILIFTAFLADMRYFNSFRGNRMDWRRAFNYAATHADEDDIIVSYWPELGEYYTDAGVESIEDISSEEAAGYDHVSWFLLDDISIWAFPEISHWVIRSCDFGLHEELILERPYSLSVYRCDPAN